MPDIYTYYREKAGQLKPLLNEEAAPHVRLLICHVLEISENEFFMRANEPMSQKVLDTVDTLIHRRANGEPLQYILGKWSFMGLEFEVSPDCLIPRQDTETLCEYALTAIRENGYKTLLDMCCGSGCIGISLAHHGKLDVTMSDISMPALSVAKRNSVKNGISANFIRSNMFESIIGRFDMITVNPPYLTKEDMSALQKELLYEPALALYGGDDGLLYYNMIKEKYREFLAPGGMLIMEIGASQARDISRIFKGVRIIKDLCGNDRVACVKADG